MSGFIVIGHSCKVLCALTGKQNKARPCPHKTKTANRTKQMNKKTPQNHPKDPKQNPPTNKTNKQRTTSRTKQRTKNHNQVTTERQTDQHIHLENKVIQLREIVGTDMDFVHQWTVLMNSQDLQFTFQLKGCVSSLPSYQYFECLIIKWVLGP